MYADRLYRVEVDTLSSKILSTDDGEKYDEVRTLTSTIKDLRMTCKIPMGTKGGSGQSASISLHNLGYPMINRITTSGVNNGRLRLYAGYKYEGMRRARSVYDMPLLFEGTISSVKTTRKSNNNVTEITLSNLGLIQTQPITKTNYFSGTRVFTIIEELLEKSSSLLGRYPLGLTEITLLTPKTLQGSLSEILTKLLSDYGLDHTFVNRQLHIYKQGEVMSQTDVVTLPRDRVKGFPSVSQDSRTTTSNGNTSLEVKVNTFLHPDIKLLDEVIVDIFDWNKGKYNPLQFTVTSLVYKLDSWTGKLWDCELEGTPVK